jgi:hypothetical protein
MDGLNSKKRIGLIVSYYLSRCDKKAVKALGYSNFTDAFNGIGDLINENPNNIKNMRDEFDPYFDNGRKGWYQRTLRASRQEVYDELARYTDEELEQLVKKLLGIVKGGKGMVKDDILRDLRALIRQSTIHYNQDFVWQDVELTDEFKDAYEEYLSKIKWSIEYYNATSVITSPTSRNIFVPNQWFVIASYAVGVYSELNRYKKYFERVADARSQKRDVYAKQLRDNASTVDKVAFVQSGKEILYIECNDGSAAEKAANRLWRFATDYSWWSGQKTVDRGDFYLSVVLNMLNLVNASQGYVGDIVNAYGSDPHLKRITRDLGAFTKNMDGVTYDIILKEEKTVSDGEQVEESLLELNREPSKHKIKISKSSIDKIGGHK